MPGLGLLASPPLKDAGDFPAAVGGLVELLALRGRQFLDRLDLNIDLVDLADLPQFPVGLGDHFRLEQASRIADLGRGQGFLPFRNTKQDQPDRDTAHGVHAVAPFGRRTALPVAATAKITTTSTAPVAATAKITTAAAGIATTAGIAAATAITPVARASGGTGILTQA